MADIEYSKMLLTSWKTVLMFNKAGIRCPVAINRCLTYTKNWATY